MEILVVAFAELFLQLMVLVISTMLTVASLMIEGLCIFVTALLQRIFHGKKKTPIREKKTTFQKWIFRGTVISLVLFFFLGLRSRLRTRFSLSPS